MIEAILIIMGASPFIAAVIAIHSSRTSSYTPHIEGLPNVEKYERTDAEIPRFDGSLADKVDTRFTNIVKNPAEDIL